MMARNMTAPTGHANYDAATCTLTITTLVKRGKKMVPLVVVYKVANLNPDPQVAYPAFRLTKADGEFYDVHVNEYGPACSCAHATFRGANSKIPCKHCLAMSAVGLI